MKKIAYTYRDSFNGLTRETWLLSLVILINRSAFMAVPFMSLYITQYLHRSIADAGIIVTMFGIGSFLGAAAGAKLCMHMDFRSVQVIAIVTSGLLFLPFGYIVNFHLLCLLSISISFFSEAFRPANFNAVAAYSRPGDETRSYSLNRLTSNLGWAIGGIIGGWIASIWYPLLFIVDGSTSIIAGLFMLFFLPKGKRLVNKAKTNIPGIKPGGPLQDRTFLFFLILTTIFIIFFTMMFRVVPVFLKDAWHVNEKTIGWIFGLNGILIALFEMVLVKQIEHRRSPVLYMMIGTIFCLIACSLLVAGTVACVLFATLAMIIFTFGEMLAMPFMNSFVITRSNRLNRERYTAGYTLSWSVAQIIGPTVGFYFAGKFGYTFLWLLLMVMLLICVIGFGKLNAGERNHIPQAAGLIEE